MTAGIDPRAVGQEVRVGYVGRENAATKARRYLLEGRLMIWFVQGQQARARCRGQGYLYELGHDLEHGWWCDCAARTRCSHLIALQSVVILGKGGDG